MYNGNQAFRTAMLSPQVNVYIKLQIFDSNYKFIREITKQVKSNLGTLTVSSDSPIRRSFKLTLDNTLGEFIFGENNLIWLDKKIKLFLGLQTWNGNIEYVPQGVFILDSPEDTHTLDSGKTATINAVDKAFYLTDKRGKFVDENTIAQGRLIPDEIKRIATQFGETQFNFDSVTDVTPYELTYSSTDNAWTAIQDLAKFAKCSVFYDVNGNLRLKKIDLEEFDKAPITWSYLYGNENEKLYAGNVRQIDTTNLYNDIVVVGGGSSTSTSRYRITVDETNSIWANHPYSVQKIGWNTLLWNNGTPDPILVNNDDCKFRAKKELLNSLGFTEKIQMSLRPNFLHDVDDTIWLEDETNGITGNKYLIKTINLPISPSLMTMDILRYNKVIDDWNFI